MATIHPRKDSKGKTRYRVQVRLKGYPAVSATFKRKTDAKEWAKNTESDIKRRRYFPYAEAQKHTFAQMIDRYLSEVMPRKSEVQQRHQTQQLKWWKKQLGPFTLAEVTPAKLASTRDELAGKQVPGEKPRSAASTNRYLAALSHVYSVAVREWGWIDQSPMRKVTRLRENPGRVRFLSNEERLELLKACEDSSEPLLYPVVVLAMSTGARQAEILNLRWRDIDLERRVFRLEKTKNRDRRALPLAGPALEEIEKLSHVRRIDSDLVFPHPDGKRPFHLRPAWVKAVEQAKLANFRFHDLRHSAASYLAMNGATLADIAEILGHKTLAMVKRYSHLTEQHTSQVVARMNEAIFGPH